MDAQAQDSAARTVRELIHSHWVLWLVQGVIMMALGLVAMAEPVMATLAVDLFVGCLFLIVGIVGLALPNCTGTDRQVGLALGAGLLVALRLVSFWPFSAAPVGRYRVRYRG